MQNPQNAPRLQAVGAALLHAIA